MAAQGRFALAWWGFRLSLLSMVGVALFCVAWLVLPTSWVRGFADQHRLWLTEHGVPIARPYRRLPDGRLARLRTMITDRATYRDLLWLLVNGTVGTFLTLVPVACLANVFWSLFILPLLIRIAPRTFDASYGFRIGTPGEAVAIGIPVAVLSVIVFLTGTRPALTAYASLTRSFLAPPERDRLANRIAQLTESRAETVDTQAAELRRIERDLHDGAQARLVALGMSLGMAENLLASDPDAAGELLAEARAATGLALAELRDLVRGIHPPVLADRGLAGAVQALALACPLPVETSVQLTGRPPAPVESAVYFAVAEALTNVAKHSGATSAWVRVRHVDGRLSVMVGDGGHGGATQEAGGGLPGIERRLAAFDGTMLVTSPAGGPTIVTMELPCVLSSPRISPSSGTA